MIAPADSKALVSACKRALDAGIVVVNIDNKLDEQVMADQGIKIPFVGPDNRAGARKVGDFLAKRLKPGDEVVVLEGIRTAFNGQERRIGLRRRDEIGRSEDRRLADRSVGDGPGESNRIGDAQRASRSQSDPVLQRQHGAWVPWPRSSRPAEPARS